jgi:hypothetical protein
MSAVFGCRLRRGVAPPGLTNALSSAKRKNRTAMKNPCQIIFYLSAIVALFFWGKLPHHWGILPRQFCHSVAFCPNTY